MDFFKNKICVVTGAASGIGRATACALAKAGAHVIISDVNQAGLDETHKMIKAANGKADAHIVDVANRDAVFAFADKVAQAHGGADIVLNNAGIAQIANVDALTSDDLKLVMDIDFWVVVNGTQAFLPQLQAKGTGHIANVSSIFGLIGIPRQSAYNAAKFAVLGFTEALRHEMADSDIHITTIHPGGINTDIVRNARLVQGSDDAARHDEIIETFKEMARTEPERAAQIIMRGIAKRKGRILIGFDAMLVDIIRRIFPTHYLRFMPFRKLTEDA